MSDFLESIKNLGGNILTKLAGNSSVKTNLLGIELNKDQLDFAYINHEGAHPVLEFTESIAFDSGVLASETEKLISKYNIEHAICNLVIAPSFYQVFRMDSPGVPEKEMKQAVYWMMHDLVDFPPENAAFDYMEIKQRGGKSEILVTITQIDEIQQYIDILSDIKLKLAVIDAKEFALSNIIPFLFEKKKDRDISLLNISESQMLVTMYREENLHLSRRLELGSTIDFSNPDLIADGILQEVKNTYDFAKTEYKIETPSQTILIPGPPKWAGVEEQLKRKYDFLDWSHIIEIKGSAPKAQINQCSGAICGALRKLSGEDYAAAD